MVAIEYRAIMVLNIVLQIGLYEKNITVPYCVIYAYCLVTLLHFSTIEYTKAEVN